MRTSAAARRALGWLAAGLLVFQSLVASTAFGAPMPAVAESAASVILCTASGPRVVALDGTDAAAVAAPAASPGPHGAGGTLPHCCAAGCAMSTGVGPPAFAGLAWRLPLAAAALPRAARATPCPHGAPAWLPQQSRAPPRAA
ncbi:hypothetical protein A7P25_07815 [Achromobacter xylosoxidans]|uniref:hypothetical protein n=1 Tax=Achromobacter ruhlandii TaxID=72557 RepID=UPI00083AF140|nr:hypothetical protein [Achromobacter ruhlandii]OCZ97300.1 hypothetical protein A7P25_07815 [Achromobacter xylosoxidans]